MRTYTDTGDVVLAPDPREACIGFYNNNIIPTHCTAHDGCGRDRCPVNVTPMLKHVRGAVCYSDGI